MGKKPTVSVTYENEAILTKNSLPCLKCVLRLSCVVHGPIYGRFMGFYVNGFLSKKGRPWERGCLISPSGMRTSLTTIMAFDESLNVFFYEYVRLIPSERIYSSRILISKASRLQQPDESSTVSCLTKSALTALSGPKLRCKHHFR